MEMDINDLLYRQQMSLIRAWNSRSVEGKAAYEGLARGYADRVDAYRQENQQLVNPVH
ncbi:hypothetical protein WG907_10670 [Sphingobium sp. AN558]|uniref:hypothetical protein n=1 Tax=Sphingobium sp. AN558 TaxID=3133442 RepID=UPI0030BE8E58